MPNRQNYLVRNTDFSALSNDLLCIKGPTLCGKGPLYKVVMFPLPPGTNWHRIQKDLVVVYMRFSTTVAGAVAVGNSRYPS